MKYRILLLLLFFITSFNKNLFSETQQINDNTLSTTKQIKAILEDDIYPNSSNSRRIVLVVEEDVQNDSLNKVLIPKYTRLICQQNEVKRLNDLDIIFASCNKIFLPLGKSIDFKGNVFSNDLKAGMSTKKNVRIPKGTKVIVKAEYEMTFD